MQHIKIAGRASKLCYTNLELAYCKTPPPNRFICDFVISESVFYVISTAVERSAKKNADTVDFKFT